MTQVNETIVNAFLAGRCAGAGNTVTDGTVILLHGHRIAEKRPDEVSDLLGTLVYGTLAGYPTKTTRGRLNAVADRLKSGARFIQKDKHQYLRRAGMVDKAIEKDGWYQIGFIK